jgi:hypothetical protein
MNKGKPVTTGSAWAKHNPKPKPKPEFKGEVVFVRDLRPGDVFVELHQHADTPRKTQTPIEVVRIGMEANRWWIRTGLESYLLYPEDAKVWLFPRKKDESE